MDNSKLNFIEVETSGIEDLITGIVGIVMTIIVELLGVCYGIIYLGIINKDYSGFGLYGVFQLLALFTLVLASGVSCYKNRRRITLFFSTTDNEFCDLNFINQNFHIVHLTSKNVAFVTNEDYNDYEIWSHYNDIKKYIK